MNKSEQWSDIPIVISLPMEQHVRPTKVNFIGLWTCFILDKTRARDGLDIDRFPNRK